MFGASAGTKWCGGHELVCHVASDSSSGRPLSRARDWEMESARMESVEARLGASGCCWGCEWERVTLNRSTAWLRCVFTASRAGR